jgi:A/G-specific adenine glycosylase
VTPSDSTAVPVTETSVPSDPHADPLAPALRRRVRQRLLSWFRKTRRDLPWRRDRDAYRIWVSEVMLQQTTVTAVIPYFERFLSQFPTLADLARASEQDVLRLWEGLGYYRRARDLHRAARLLAEGHASAIPNDPEVLRRLPGFGRYTLGAVLSQAFDRRLPIVEANSLRVLCRLFGSRDDPRRGPGQRWLWQTAEELLPQTHVGDFNQALMELGALVCTPIAPQCARCPLADVCVAHRLGLQEQIPTKPESPQTTEVHESAIVLRRGDEVFLAQRPETASRWANLWEFPHGPLTPGETHEQAAQRLVLELTGMKAALGSELLRLRHGVTRFRITMVCFEATYLGGQYQSSGAAGQLPGERPATPSGPGIDETRPPGEIVLIHRDGKR